MYLQLERPPGLQWPLFSEVHGLEPEEGGMPYDTAEISFADLLLSLTNTLIAEATYPKNLTQIQILIVYVSSEEIILDKY